MALWVFDNKIKSDNIFIIPQKEVRVSNIHQ